MSISFRIVVGLTILVLAAPVLGQSPSTDPAIVPHLVNFTGRVLDAQGQPRSGMVGITFALYKEEQGGAALWLETQSVQLDESGHYSVYLGKTKSGGVPPELFITGEAHWLGVQVDGEAELPRVLLVSTPYALKAADAETIGGLPPSAFVLATPSAAPSAAATAAPSASTDSSAPPANPAVTGLGTVSFIPLWDTTSDIVNSVLFQSGSGTTAKVGINTTTPSTTLDVKGSGTIRGTLTMPTTGTATATAGKNSQPVNQVASSFNSSTHAAVNETFRWQAEPAANNTANPSATLNLLFGAGTASATETGLKISNAGIFTFADTQTFPGTGTLTGLTAGAGMTGGGTSGNVTLGLTSSCSNGQVLQWNGTTWACTTLSSSGTITGVTAGTDLSGGGTTGNVTLNLDTTKVPQLNAANTFTGNQTVSGNMSATGVVTGSSFQIGSNLFAYGSYANSNAFLGFGGNSSTTGLQNTAVGVNALIGNTSGGQNTAIGFLALPDNTTGTSNTAVGSGTLNVNSVGFNNTAAGTAALQSNTTGPYNTAYGVSALSNNTTGEANTAIGYSAGPDAAHPALNNTTAIGDLATVTASNSIVLGSIAGVSGAASSTNVGIGTTAPAFTLDVHGNGNFTGPIAFAAGQTFPGAGTITGVNPGTALTGGGSSGSVTLSVDTTKVVTGITAGTDLTGGGTGGVQTLNLDTTKVPQLNTANTFTGNQTVSGNLTATGVVSGSSYQIGSSPFAFGSANTFTAYLGFAGNATNTGSNNTGVGFGALGTNTVSGSGNTAIGKGALSNDTSGYLNVGVGVGALVNNITGALNMGLGANAGPSTDGLENATAIGAYAQVTESNALVLGSINGVNFANASTLVGIGTTAPIVQLQVQGNDSTGTGVQSLTNNTSTSGNSFAVVATTSSAGVTSEMVADGIGTGPLATPSGYFGTYTNQPIGFITGNALRMFFDTTGKVGINTKTPDNTLSVNGSADKVGGGSWGTFSDGRLKDLNGSFQSGLTEVLKLHPIRYRYKEENAMGIRDHDEHIGFVAQDVQKVIPEAVTENSRGYLLVNNDPILWAMLNAIQEQQDQIREQRQQIRTQQRQIASLNGKLGVLEAALRTTGHAGKSSAVVHSSNPTHHSSSAEGELHEATGKLRDHRGWEEIMNPPHADHRRIDY